MLLLLAYIKKGEVNNSLPNFINKDYIPSYFPLTLIFVGVLVILGWSFIIQWIMVIVAIILFILGIGKLKLGFSLGNNSKEFFA